MRAHTVLALICPNKDTYGENEIDERDVYGHRCRGRVLRTPLGTLAQHADNTSMIPHKRFTPVVNNNNNNNNDYGSRHKAPDLVVVNTCETFGVRLRFSLQMSLKLLPYRRWNTKSVFLTTSETRVSIRSDTVVGHRTPTTVFHVHRGVPKRI